MSMRPLVCTQNTHSHVDYGIPILASKSTDYRTSTGTYHRNIPNIPQHFDCRVRAKIKKGLLDKDIALREDVASTYSKEYPMKSNCEITAGKYDKPMQSDHVKYIRDLEEKLRKPILPPLKPGISLMKDSYQNQYNRPNFQELVAPSLSGICEIRDLYRPLQHRLAPEQSGYCKQLDIYLTENNLQYVPYSTDQMRNATEHSQREYHGTRSPIKPPVPANKFLSRGQKRVPNFGMKSEFQAEFKPQNYSDVYSYIQENSVEFEDSLSEAGPWQNLCPPGMYCSENCHIATGWPVRCVIDIGKSK